MAENLDDGEFWLPSQFLTDDDEDASFCSKNPKNDDVFNAVTKSLFPYLSSSSETESSDEEDHLAELTRRVALQLDLHHSEHQPKGVFAGGSPQSTLSAFGSSGKGSSPNGGVSNADCSSATFDLLRAAAGEVERMRLSEEDNRRYGFSFNNAAPKVNAVNFNGFGFYNSQQQQQPSLSQQQLHIAQFQMMRQQQMAKQQQQSQMVPNRERNNNNNNNGVRGGNTNTTNNVGLGLSATAWPHGSGMRAVFLGGKRESTGTGVFLPRVHEARKKPGCNTVLVPDRVAQALNLKLEGMVGGNLNHQHQHQHQQKSLLKGSVVTRVKSNNFNNNSNWNGYGYHTYQKRNNNNLKHQQTQVVNQEIHLPQEWTY
ncbi:hypothetical protein VNO78_25768 [Psophocarpus tetragonolobus]|uniref:Uncharacterized protein n=1 Tax=Psophocarpus tetragonolobus TaxID=3891 RepID=A0AAN9XFQ1_PSOTE